MKKLYIILFTPLLINAAYAQQQIFMRIYNTSGNKFHKGYFVRTTDSSLVISATSGVLEVPATSIGYIKTKRSTVHGVLVGALAGIVPISVLGTEPGKPYRHSDILDVAEKDTSTPAPAAKQRKQSKAEIPEEIPPAALTRRATFTIRGDINTWRSQRRIMEMQLVKN